MILRKPYAFLIKNFKIIHLFISLLLIYLIKRTYNIISFYKSYSQNSLIEVIPSHYTGFLIYFSIILLIGLVVAIVFLLKKKNKPILFYIITIIVYVAIFIGFTYNRSIINTLEMQSLDRKTIGLARDITRFMLIAQGILLIPYIIRTLGFDIKKFDFKKDLQELDIEVDDNEEFELTIGVDKNKLERKGRRRLRELKYYYIENKIFILIIAGIVALFLGVKSINFITSSIVHKYSEQDIISLNGYKLTIDDSYITTKNDNGKNIVVNDEVYLIVKFTVNSSYNGIFTLDSNKFIVKIKDDSYTSNRKYNSYFTSYGIGYKGQKISLNDSKTYILVYSIPSADKNKNMTLEYNYSSNGSVEKKIIKLSPEIVD